MTTWTLSDLSSALRDSWAEDTCSPDDAARSPWGGDNPAWGHCDITAVVGHDLFGGELVVGEVYLDGEQHGYHYWNRLPSGLELDLTREQFRLGQRVTGGRTEVRPTGRLPRRHEEYERLRRRLESRLGAPLPRAEAPGSPDSGEAR